jgi:phenylalanine-4-hydroxylase
MKLTVFRYKVWDHLNDNHVDIAPYYAIREFIEHLEGATVIEDDFLEVDESDLDTHGRIAILN